MMSEFPMPEDVYAIWLAGVVFVSGPRGNFISANIISGEKNMKWETSMARLMKCVETPMMTCPEKLCREKPANHVRSFRYVWEAVRTAQRKIR
jgi:hypothetical protein